MTKALAALNIFYGSHSALMKHGLTIKVSDGGPYYSYNIKVYKFTPSMRVSKKVTGWDIRNIIKEHVEELRNVLNGTHDLGFYIKCAMYRNYVEFSF